MTMYNFFIKKRLKHKVVDIKGNDLSKTIYPRKSEKLNMYMNINNAKNHFIVLALVSSFSCSSILKSGLCFIHALPILLLTNIAIKGDNANKANDLKINESAKRVNMQVVDNPRHFRSVSHFNRFFSINFLYLFTYIITWADSIFKGFNRNNSFNFQLGVL